ncbi:MAG: extracellular solute-binding protein [Opitutaceae bacterium]
MKRWKPTIFGVLILASIYALAGWRILNRDNTVFPSDSGIVVRFAHWNLQAGMREAYDSIIAQYEADHPGVRIEQMAIPLRVWPTWQQTQLVGETAPDIVQLGRGTNDEIVSRYFLPLAALVEEPNPYNVGTPLAGLAWRNTFLDGLTGTNILYPSLQEIFGIPTMQMNLRMFYNADLLETVSGSRRPPESFAEFRRIAEKTEAYAVSTNQTILPIAGSGDYGLYLALNLQQAMTTQIARKLDVQDLLRVDASRVGASYVAGAWSLDSPPIIESLRIYQMMGRWMQPGFLQLRREDAAMYFSQRRALAMVTGSWDYYLLQQECNFPFVVGPLPIPDERDPEFPTTAAAHRNELDGQLNGIFGVVRSSRHPDVAIDFLRFLSGQSMAKQFAETSKTLSATVGVLPDDKALLTFMPNDSGPVGGFQIIAGAETNSWFQRNVNKLFAPGATAVSFAREQMDPYRVSTMEDLRNYLRRQRQTSERSDTIVIAEFYRGGKESSRLNAILDAQVSREQDGMQIEWMLRSSNNPSPLPP